MLGAKFIRLIMVLFAIALTGCATMNKQECETADWYQIGYEDGTRGYTEQRLAKHRQACARHGVTPVLRSYQDGYDEGVIPFCTLHNGFSQGKKGYEYTGICPSELEIEFLQGYNAGQEIYSVASSIDALTGRINRNDEKLDRLKKDIVSAETTLWSPETLPVQKKILYDSITDMKRERHQLESRNRELQFRLDGERALLRRLEYEYDYY